LSQSILSPTSVLDNSNPPTYTLVPVSKPNNLVFGSNAEDELGEGMGFVAAEGTHFTSDIPTSMLTLADLDNMTLDQRLRQF
jgi:hypothetical protein